MSFRSHLCSWLELLEVVANVSNFYLGKIFVYFSHNLPSVRYNKPN